MFTRDASAANLIAGTATRYLVLGLNIGVGILLMPFTVRHLGQTEYGLWMLVASMTTYFQLLDLGYGNGVVRHLVDADRRGDATEVNCIASTFVCVYAMIAAVACLAIVVMVLVVVPRFPHLTAAQVGLAQLLLAMLGARVAIGFPLTVYGAVSNARQGFVVNNLVASAVVVASAASTYVVLVSGGGLVTLVAVTTTISLCGYAGYAWNAYRMMPTLRLHPRFFSLARWRDVTTFSVYLFVIQLASQICFNIDNVVIGASLGPALVAVYTVALRLAEYQRRLCDQFSGMLFPVVMGFANDVDALRRALVEGNRVGATLVTGASVVLIGFSGPLIRHWMGASFAGSVAPFVILAVAGMIIVSQAASSNVLIARGGHRLVAGIWISEAIGNLILSVVLVRSMGLVGVAVGTLLPLLAGHLVVMLAAACRRVGLPIGPCLVETMRPAAIAGTIAAAGCVYLRLTYPPASTLAVLLEGAAVGMIYLLALLTVGFDARTRTAYLAQARAAVDTVVDVMTGLKGKRPAPERMVASGISGPP
ncbi:MAG: rane protein involved in the export of O-antigen and teichoic acid [Acidobacteria bacterium]|nr:rane protein involved in the export of O-antigen and teichoic acid [Acidobacteriota bacterium]